MKRFILLPFLVLGTLCTQGQATFKARVFLPGGHSVSGLYASLMMLVEDEDTARYAPRLGDFDTLGGSVCFTGVTRGARCYLHLNGVGMQHYDYPAFTIDGDMEVDSLVLRDVAGVLKLYWCRARRDSALNADVAALGGDPMARDTIWHGYGDGHINYWVDPDTRALKLARIYYGDWMLPIASWRTFPRAADSAYRYALIAYDSRETPWLYPAICQLHSHLGLQGEPKVLKPKQPKVMYTPLPYDEASLSDSTIDLMTPTKRWQWLSDLLEKVLPEFGEPSLCCPVAEEGTLRYMVWSPWGYINVLRLQGHRVYVNRASGWPTEKMKLTAYDEFDLSDNQLAEVRRLMDAFLSAPLPDEVRGGYVIDGADYLLEYIHNGQYRSFRAPQGGTPEVFDALTEYLWSLYKSRHYEQ